LYNHTVSLVYVLSKILVLECKILLFNKTDTGTDSGNTSLKGIRLSKTRNEFQKKFPPAIAQIKFQRKCPPSAIITQRHWSALTHLQNTYLHTIIAQKEAYSGVHSNVQLPISQGFMHLAAKNTSSLLHSSILYRVPIQR
jgi:hypothetical protein